MTSVTSKKLFTPGPLGCTITVKESMLRDLGSRDVEIMDAIKLIREKLLVLAGVSPKEYVTILLQGSGTFAVEGVFQTVCPREGARALVLINGAYGKRMKAICDAISVPVDTIEFREDQFVDPLKVQEFLDERQTDYSIVAVVHCETSSGVLNPVEEIGRTVKALRPRATYLVDAMSSFGAVPLDLSAGPVDFVVSSANKCFQGVPGFSFILGRRAVMQRCKGNCRSLCLDLVDQCEGLDTLGQFRFTPPTHSMLAFVQALREYEEEGGLQARANRYKGNWIIIQDGMKEMGFRKLLSGKGEGYIISTFHFPNHKNFTFKDFYLRLNNLGQVIYPGKVTQADCFRIGNIGELYPEDMLHLLECIKKVMSDMGIPIPVS